MRVHLSTSVSAYGNIVGTREGVFCKGDDDTGDDKVTDKHTLSHLSFRMGMTSHQILGKNHTGRNDTPTPHPIDHVIVICSDTPTSSNYLHIIIDRITHLLTAMVSTVEHHPTNLQLNRTATKSLTFTFYHFSYLLIPPPFS